MMICILILQDWTCREIYYAFGAILRCFAALEDGCPAACNGGVDSGMMFAYMAKTIVDPVKRDNYKED